MFFTFYILFHTLYCLILYFIIYSHLRLINLKYLAVSDICITFASLKVRNNIIND